MPNRSAFCISICNCDVCLSRSSYVLGLSIHCLVSTLLSRSLHEAIQRTHARTIMKAVQVALLLSSFSSTLLSAVEGLPRARARANLSQQQRPEDARWGADLAAQTIKARLDTLSTPVADLSPTATPDDNVAWPVGTASMPSTIFNLIKLIVGAGVLGLPAGIAAFGDHPSALVPAFLLFCGIGAMAAYGFSLIGTVCAATQARSYRQAWSRSVGAASSWLPATACLLVTCCSVLCNSMIQADTIPAIVQAATGHRLSRTTALWTITGTVLLPLCLLKELSSLAPYSLIGIFGMVYTSGAMTYRWWAASYTTPGAPLAAALAPRHLPHFGARGWESALSTNAAILVAMLSSCTCNCVGCLSCFL
jgi:hypothetical protein